MRLVVSLAPRAQSFVYVMIVMHHEFRVKDWKLACLGLIQVSGGLQKYLYEKSKSIFLLVSFYNELVKGIT